MLSPTHPYVSKQDTLGIIIIDASVLKLRRGVFCWGLRNEPGVQNLGIELFM